MWEKAQEYLFKAGDQAGRIAADAEALAHYQQAIAAYARVFGDRWDPIQRASLERKMGEAFYRRGEHKQAMEYLQRALTYLGKSLPTSRWRVRLGILREIIIQIGHRLLPRLFVKTIDASVSQAVEEEARIYEIVGWIDVTSDHEHFLWLSLRMLNFCERKGFHLGAVIAFTGLEIVGVFMSLFWLSEWYGNMALQLAERIQHPGALGMSYQNLAVYEIYTGTLNKALEHSLRGAEAYRKGGYWNLHGWALTIYFVIKSYLYQGNLANALTYAQDLVRFGQDTNDSQMLVWGLTGRGLAQDRKGDFAEAIINLKKAIQLAEAVPDHRSRAMAGGDLGKCYLRQGDLGQALAILEENEHYRTKYKMKRYFPALRNGLVGAYLLAAEQSDQNERENWLRKAGRSRREALGRGRNIVLG